MFAVFALVAFVAWLCLWKGMPETAQSQGEKLRLKSLLADYRQVFGNLRFVCGAASIGFSALPLLAWVAISPVILIDGEGLTPVAYGWLQVPVFTGLIIGNLVLSKLSGKVNIQTPLWLGIVPVILGLAIAAGSALWMVNAWWWIIGGLSLYALGTGLVNAGLYRLTLFSSQTGKGTVAAALGLLTIVVFAVGIEVAKKLYFAQGYGIFMLAGLIFGVTGALLIIRFLKLSRKTA